MADFRLGRLKFKWKGNWTASTAYVIDDIVKYGANSYVCTTNHTSAANENLFYSADLAKWQVHTEGVVSKGDWAATTWYKVNDVVKYGNTQYRVTTGHTSGATFSDTNLTVYVEGLKYENTWVANTTYQVGDIVGYGGYSYSAKTNHSSATVPNADSTNWAVLTVGFQAKGEWASGTTYKLGDTVRYGGNSYVNKLTVAAGGLPTDTTYWTLLAEGFNWKSAWVVGTAYKLGDVVSRASNSYVCIQANTGNDPSTDTNGTWWNYIAQGGSAAQVLTTTGDMLYQSAGTIARLGLPAGSTGSAAEQKQASGQVLTVGGSPLLPRWETNNTSAPVYYVTKEGSDSNSGKQISRGFGTIRYALDYIGGLTGADAPSITNPISLYVKAGVYEEILPMHIPAYVSVLGDNIRTTVIKPAAGNSNHQDLGLAANQTHFKRGEIISNHDGTKTAKVLDTNGTNSVEILNVSGGVWDTNDKYVDLVSNKSSDAGNNLVANKQFMAYEAYHRHVANVGAVSGTEATVKTRLENLVNDLAYNITHGSNNKVWDYTNALISGTAITGNNAQDTQLVEYLNAIGAQVMRNENVTISSGNDKVQVTPAITADTASPKCATEVAALQTLTTIVTSCISASSMSGTAKTEPYINISTATTRTNPQSTGFFCANHAIVKDLVLEGLTGFVANGGNDKDIEGSTYKGVYFRLDPASAITKSPYVQNCSALGGAGVGALVDGDAHVHFDNSSTKSFKSMCFDAYTQVLEGGVGIWSRGTSAVEAVSSFTYYCHISYAATGGARIRAVSGNSSYGKYGAISRGFDSGETTTNGTVSGLRIEINPSGSKSGTFQVNERFTGGTSGAVGELRSDQIEAANYIYYIPVKGTFQTGELITGVTSSATHTIGGAGSVGGQKGFLLTVEGLSAAPDQGGSVEMVDNGSNNDAGSYVISSSSYTAPDGRGTLTVTRAQLGTTGAAHDGTTAISLFPTPSTSPTSATLGGAIASGASSPVTATVNATTNMSVNGHLIIGNEMFKIVSFPSPTSVELTRSVEGTSAQAHSANDAITILGAKVASQDEVIKDVTSSITTIRSANAGTTFKANDYIKIDNEFMKLGGAAADTTGITILNFADEKSIASGDGQGFKIRYRYSQVRLTAHDFLDVGTGDRTQTNWPFLSSQPNVPSQEIDESRPGRVYYVSTDQDGNFAVGNYFKVEQATGKATLNANAFDLTGLDTLRLGAIGAQLGATIDEFSIDGTLSQNSDEKVPTQKAVKTYVDNATGGSSLTVGDGSTTGTVALATQTLTIAGTANEIETSHSGQTLTVGLPNDITVGNNLTVTGNLTVNGTTTTVSTSNTTISDKLLELGTGRTGNATGDAGIVIERGDDANIFIGYDESTDTVRFASGTFTGASTGDLSFANDVSVTLGDISTTRLRTNEVIEKVNFNSGTALTGTVALDLATNCVHYFDTNASGDFTLNLRGDGSTTLNSFLNSNESLTCAVISDMGGTAYKLTGLQIDGTNVWTNVIWQGGAEPSAGTDDGTDSYFFTIIKTGANAYKVMASFTSYKDPS